MSKFILPKIWYLELETKEMFNELCLPYNDDFNFYKYIGITNDKKHDTTTCGDYYYIDNVNHSIGEKITYQQFKRYVINEQPESYSYLITLFKKLNIK